MCGRSGGEVLMLRAGVKGKRGQRLLPGQQGSPELVPGRQEGGFSQEVSKTLETSVWGG